MNKGGSVFRRVNENGSFVILNATTKKLKDISGAKKKGLQDHERHFSPPRMNERSTDHWILNAVTSIGAVLASLVDSADKSKIYQLNEMSLFQ